MRRTSITDATNNPSPLIDRVRLGETVLICDRNRPVARLQPVGPGDACRLVRVHPLRAADVLQLAAATVMAGGRAAQARFMAFDDRLREAASREGFLLGL